MEIVYYEKANGRVPVLEFIQSLDNAEDRVKIQNKIDMLAELGHTLNRPHAGHLEDQIYELIIKSNRTQHRILYFFYHRGTIVLALGFIKKTRKVPPKYIEQAKEYREHYQETHREDQL